MRNLNSIWRMALPAAVCTVAAGLAVAQTSAEDLKITVGKSIVIDYPTDVSRISTSNPDIVDAVAVSTREILLHAKAHGVCTIVVWAKSGQRTFYNASVEHNLAPIRKLLSETFPNEDIQLQAARDSVTLTGVVSAKEVSDRAAALVASLAKTVINNLRLTTSPVDSQILLRVKFAELSSARPPRSSCPARSRASRKERAASSPSPTS
jgi:pilus assembly protein CpaC